MNLARVRVNDTAFGIDGDLLSDDKPYTPTMLNAAWRWLQREAANRGIETYKKEVFLYGIPAAASTDISNQCFIGLLGCSDGVNEQESPALPADMILPLTVQIRESGNTQVGYVPMRQAENGLPNYWDCYVYDYRTDGIYFYGASTSLDMRIRYSAYLADLQLGQDGAIAPILFCQDVLSARVAYEFCAARGAAATPLLQQMAEDALATMSKSTGRRKQPMSIRRQPYSRRGACNIWPVIR